MRRDIADLSVRHVLNKGHLLRAIGVGIVITALTAPAFADDIKGTSVIYYDFEEESGRGPVPNQVAGASELEATLAPEGIEWVASGKDGKGLKVSEPSANEDLSRYGFFQVPYTVLHDRLEACDLSVSFWYQPLDSEPGGEKGYRYFIDNQYSSKAGFVLYMTGGSHAMTLVVGNGQRILGISSGALSWRAGKWYHIQFSYTCDSGTLKLYRDGEELAFQIDPAFGKIAVSGKHLRVGNRLGSTYSPLPGIYDDFTVKVD